MATNVIGTTVYNGHTYHILTSDELGSTAAERWENAKIHCANLGGYLAIIDDANENSALFSYLQSLGVNNAYFGLSDAAQEGTWTWVDGTPLTFSNWGTGASNGDEPNGSTYENYGMFYEFYPNGEWNDGDFIDSWTLNGGSVFICEVDSVAPVVTPALGEGYDIVFILDNTSSMNSYITNVRNNIVSFANSLASKGINYRLGLVSFGDVAQDSGKVTSYGFTDVATFINNVNNVLDGIQGGGDIPESGLEALVQGEQSALAMISTGGFNNKRFVVVTDAPFHNQGDTVDFNGNITGDASTFLSLVDVINTLKTSGVVVDVIGTTNAYLSSAMLLSGYPVSSSAEHFCDSEWTQITSNTGGKFYDINGDYNLIFDEITKEISGEGDTPIFNDTLEGRIMFAQWGYGFTPPEGNPLFVDQQLAISADLADDFGSPILDDITPVNFAVTQDDFTAKNFTPAAFMQAYKLSAASKPKFS